MTVFQRRYATISKVYIALCPSGTTNISTNPTLAAGDVQVSKDGGAFANLTTLPAVTPAAGGSVEVTFSAAELTCSRLVVRFIDQTATKEWEDMMFTVDTYGHTSAEHPQIGQTLVSSEGTAQAGASQAITLAAGDSATTDKYMGNLVYIDSGTGSGQSRIGIAYNGTTKVLSVDQPWHVLPDNTSKYKIYNFRLPPMDGNLGVVVQAIIATAIDNIWEHGTTNITTAGGIGKFILDNMNALNDADAIETGYNLVQTIRIMAAALAGNLSGAGSSQELIRDMTNVKDRINATVDANGNRTITMLDGD